MMYLSLIANPYFAIFLFALTLRLWFNFLVPHVNSAFACDAYEYLRDAQGLEKLFCAVFGESNIWQIITGKVLAIHWHEIRWHQIRTILSSLQELSVGGPIFPLFLLVSFVMFGVPVTAANWAAPVIMQSILSATTCVLIALIGKEVWDQKAGLIAGFLAVLYPGFIINSGRLYTETFATFLVCSILLISVRILIRGRTTFGALCLMGALAGALQMTRSVMGSFTILLLIVVAVTQISMSLKKTSVNLLAFILGLSVAFLPSLLLQYLVLGKTSLIVDRRSHYNFFLGNNISTAGWLSFPYPDCAAVGEKSFWQMVQSAIASHPLKWFWLMLAKPIRLFKFPWNDFRLALGPIDFSHQVFFHQFVLLAAGLGIMLAFFLPGRIYPWRRYIFARLLILAVLLLHGFYIFFEAISRHALTAIPVLLLFAGAGLSIFVTKADTRLMRFRCFTVGSASLLFFFLSRCDFTQMYSKDLRLDWLTVVLACQVILRFVSLVCFCWACFSFEERPAMRRLSAGIITLVFLFIFSSTCLPMREHGRWYEWSRSINQSGTQLTRTVNLSRQAWTVVLRDQPFVAINTVNRAAFAEAFQVSINGIVLDGPYIPALALAQDLSNVKVISPGMVRPEVEYLWTDITAFAGLSPLQMRQWFLIPIPEKVLKQILILNALPPNLQITVTKLNNSHSQVFGGAAPTGTSIDKMESLPSIAMVSADKAMYGVENDAYFNDPSYDLKYFGNPGANSDDNSCPYIQLLLSRCGSLTPAKQKLLEEVSLCPDAHGLSNKQNPIIWTAPVRAMPLTADDTFVLIRIRGKIVLTTSTGSNQACSNQTNSNTLQIESICQNLNGQTVVYPCAWLLPQLPVYREAANALTSANIDYCYPMLINSASKQWLKKFTAVRVILTCPTQHSLGADSELKLCIYSLPNFLAHEEYAIY